MLTCVDDWLLVLDRAGIVSWLVALSLLKSLKASVSSTMKRSAGMAWTCRTCHSSDDGTLDPEEVVARLAENPSDPLFLHDGLDDFVSGTTRISAHATT